MSTSCRRYIFIIVLLVLCNVRGYSRDVRIGLLSYEDLFSLTVKIQSGQYRLSAGGKVLTLNPGANILVTKAGERLFVSIAGQETIASDSLVLRHSEGADAVFSIRNNIVPGQPGQYSDDLVVMPGIRSLLAVNVVDINRYLAGVVQSEAGYKGGLEYFKAQAVIARTYFYMHSDRHKQDGYNICDRTHCQVYKGMSVTEMINNAVLITEGMVLTNKDSILVFTPFHANCGGQTEVSGNVWLNNEGHLKSVSDPYCGFSASAAWTREISLEKWLDYLAGHGYRHKNLSDLGFDQLSRKKNYRAGEFVFPLSKLRLDWDLMSAFFSVEVKDSSVYLDGRGYGHGVGLCQDGARVMADRGFRMREILNFYFSDLLVMDIKDAKADLM